MDGKLDIKNYPNERQPLDYQKIDICNEIRGSYYL